MMEVLKTVMTQNYLFNQSIKVLAQTDTSILRKYNSACHKGVQLIYIPSVTFTFYNLIRGRCSPSKLAVHLHQLANITFHFLSTWWVQYLHTPYFPLTHIFYISNIGYMCIAYDI